MSFSLPKNVPRFDNDQRAYENVYWGASRRPQQNGHASNGIGLNNPINGSFDKNSLPMYKDKPYSYAASQRLRPFFRRKRFWLGAVLSVLALGFFWTFLRSSKPVREERKPGDASSWNWLKKSSSAAPDWDLRRDAVREAFKLSWDGYAKHAWGMDEYHPLTRTGRQMTPTGMGWIIVDALDTLMIMNLTSRLSHARDWMSTSLSYNQDHEVNTFETTIRMLGGLLSAHYLSTEYPDMAPLAEDDPGKPGEDLYLEKAADLADRLLGAFDTDSGVPYSSVNLKTLKGAASHNDGGASSTAEAGSLQLEFKYLAMLMGEKLYWEKTEKIIQVIDDNGMQDGLVPIFIYPDKGTFRTHMIRLGSRGDSYYEYLIKQYLQTSKEEPVYKDLWDQALDGVRKHLLTYTTHYNLSIIGELTDGIGHRLTPKMDHLVCFMPGAIALGATEGLPVSEARKLPTWTQKKVEEMHLAAELTKTCYGMYKATITGLAPEISYFDVHDPLLKATDGLVTSKPIDFSATIPGETAPWEKDYNIKAQDSHNLQRPETVESLFYMWRITGDPMYREWGWEMFKSFVEYATVEGGAGFTSLSKANQLPPVQKDNMESFWLAETLKYFYLLFSPTDLLPLSGIVINTEAHIFPRFKLQRGLKTGWSRKERGEDGQILKAGKEEVRQARKRGKEPRPIAKRIRVVEGATNAGEGKNAVFATAAVAEQSLKDESANEEQVKQEVKLPGDGI